MSYQGPPAWQVQPSGGYRRAPPPPPPWRPPPAGSVLIAASVAATVVLLGAGFYFGTREGERDVAVAPVAPVPVARPAVAQVRNHGEQLGAYGALALPKPNTPAVEGDWRLALLGRCPVNYRSREPMCWWHGLALEILAVDGGAFFTYGPSPEATEFSPHAFCEEAATVGNTAFVAVFQGGWEVERGTRGACQPVSRRNARRTPEGAWSRMPYDRLREPHRY